MPVTPELIQYITQARQAGLSDDQIRSELLRVGWGVSDVDVAVPPKRQELPPQPILQNPFQSTQTRAPAGSVVSPSTQMPTQQVQKKHSRKGFYVTVLIVLLFGAGVYFFLPQIILQWEKFFGPVEEEVLPPEFFDIPMVGEEIPNDPMMMEGSSMTGTTSLEVMDTEDWEFYQNTRFGFKFKYPPSARVSSNDYGVTNSSVASWVTVYSEIENTQIFNINERSLPEAATSLSDYVTDVWNRNSADSVTLAGQKNIGPLKESVLLGRRAYEFEVSHSFLDDRGGFLLPLENEDYRFVYISDGEDRYYLVWYQSNNSLQSSIFGTLDVGL